MINCISAFTSPIIQFGVADSESFRSKLIAQIYDEKEQTESVSYSNGGGGWQSPPQRKLPELVESTLSHIMSNVLTEDHAYTIGNLWYNVTHHSRTTISTHIHCVILRRSIMSRFQKVIVVGSRLKTQTISIRSNFLMQ